MGLSGIRAVHVPHVVCPKILHQVWLPRVALIVGIWLASTSHRKKIASANVQIWYSKLVFRSVILM